MLKKLAKEFGARFFCEYDMAKSSKIPSVCGLDPSLGLLNPYRMVPPSYVSWFINPINIHI